MNSESRRKLQIILSFAGVLALLAGVAVGAATMRPTEATWQDTVTGQAAFAMKNPYKGNSFARAVSTYGFMDRATWDDEVSAVTAFPTPDATINRVGPKTHDSATWILQLLHVNTVGFSCATIANSESPCPVDADEQLPGAMAKAVSETQSLDVNVSRGGLGLVTYRGDPIRATASCSPTQTAATLSEDAKIAVGRDAIFDTKVHLSIPAPNKVSSIPRSWGSYDYTVSLHHVREIKPGYALSQLRLRVETTGTAGAERWNLNLILAHAECGVDTETTNAPDRPSQSDIWPASSPQQFRMARTNADAPAPLQPITDLVEDAPADEAEFDETDVVEDETGEAADAVADPNETELPSLPGVDETAAPETATTTAATAPTTSTSTTATSAPADPTTRTTETSSPANKSTESSTTVPVTSAPATTAPVTTESAISEPPVSESAEPTAPTETTRAPQQPKGVTVGRWFTVTGPDGAELGTAKIEDIVRTPGCGVQLTLHLTTSDETGAARWASIGPSDFAEVRPGGTTRDARRISSDCEQANHSRSTALSPGRDYEIVIAFQLSDTTSRAMLRPEGTAGWIFDLPASALPTTTQPPVTTTVASAPETTVQTAEA